MSIRSLCVVTACLLTLAAAPAVRADERDTWKHNDGSFKQVKGDQWLEVLKDKKIDCVEKARTDEYVELYDPNRKATVRLFDNRCELKYDADVQFKKHYDGKWKKEAASTTTPPADPKPADPKPSDPKPAATGKPEDR